MTSGISPDLSILSRSYAYRAISYIVRNQGELTLINPVRLDDKCKTDLDALGKVAHVM